MSTQSYAKWWNLTKEQLQNLQSFDNFTKQSTKPVKSRVRAGQLIAGLYVRYCRIVQDLDTCLDQVYQIQKRFTIRKLTEAAVIRLNELKEALKDIELSEIHYVDGALVELQLVPQDIEILNPALIFPRPDAIQEMWERIQKGERIFIPPVEPLDPSKTDVGAGTMSQSPVVTESPEPVTEEKKEEKKKRVKKFMLDKKDVSESQLQAFRKKELIRAAVNLIQTHERARQARIYCLDIGQHKRDNPEPDKVQSSTKKLKISLSPEAADNAAIGFQKLYRGHMVREREKRREKKRRLLIGMTEPSWKSHEEQEIVQRAVERRREIVKQRIKDYINANLKEKERVMRVIAPGLLEDIGDEIREWFYQWYIRAKTFDKIPPEEKGGTVLVVRCETFTPEEYLDDVEKKRREKEKQKDKGADAIAKEKAEKEKKKKEEEKKKKEAAKKKKEQEKKEKAKRNKEFEFKFAESPAMQQLKEGFKEYRKLWGARRMVDNPDDNLYMDMITDQKCYEMQLEVRRIVDELMRVELELLNNALAFDKAKKGKKGGKKGKKKGKKGKKGKKPKIDKKDITRNRKTEDLFQELVDNGIIRTYPVTHLSQFKGDFSYANWDRRQEEYDPLPCLGDIRQTVALNCILPLGVESMQKPRSVLIAGPKKSGKHLLANAIFTETKCVLFDLSPPILAGKYQGKPGLKMLVHLVSKMSRLLQPSIIFFDGAEKPFYKKVPKNERELEPKKMGGQLFKGIVKPITPQDRVLVLGISEQPWAGKPAGMKKAFERVILIPRTDYGSAFLCWHDSLMKYHGVDRDIDLSSLAKVSVNYPLCVIEEVVKEVLSPRRIVELSYNPLRQLELYEALIENKIGSIPDKDFNKFTKWYKKTPLGKTRAIYQAIVDKVKEGEAKLAAKEAEKAAKKKN